MEKQEFYLGSVKYEKQQQAIAARTAHQHHQQATPGLHGLQLHRDFAVLAHARLEIEERAFMQLKAMMFPSSMWSILKDSDMTNHFRSLVFISASKIGALTERDLATPHSKPPFSLFLSLEKPGLAERLEKENVHNLDAFSREFIRRNGLTSDLAKYKLVLIMWLLHMNNNRLELLNAKTRRHVKKHVQCKQADVLEISTKMFFQHYRDDPNVTPCKVDEAMGDSGTGSASAVDDREGPPLRATWTGGAWRAFVRKMASRNLREVAEMYNIAKATLGDQVFRECVELGREATAANIAGRVGNSFGPSRRDVQRKVKKLQLAAQMDAIGAGGADVSRAAKLESVLLDATTYDYSMDETTQIARRLVLEAGRLKGMQEKRDADDVARFVDAATARWRAEVATLGPDMAELCEKLVASPPPCSGLVAFRPAPTSTVADADELLSYAETLPTKSSGTDFLRSVDTLWVHAHREKRNDREDVAKSSSSEDEEAAESWCFLQGKCLCPREGVMLHRFRNSVLRGMKVALPFSGNENWRRPLLGQGEVLLKFVAAPVVSVADDDAELAELWGMEDLVVIWHVSHMSYSPYKPMLQSMTIASEEEAAKAGRVHPEVCLKVIS
jgi:hypothetical protein